uniref:Uncharacterized protein n=1 Tax=Haptolina brevifila TaxID=156173 RepID=A0A7S2CAY1_9EUKA|mmetsp:Transcript_22642/g.45434  ORF Transcript_22642/g.45434 Transcript_22642/m.45434 type:complete len:154 (+) Transcript_22642:609-1070(+)
MDKELSVSGGVDLNNDGVVAGDELVPLTMQWFKSLVDQLDGDMQVWTIYMNTHCAWCVDDLTPTVRSLQQAGVPFFGPTMRADGVYQLYLELPAHHYVEVDSVVYNESAAGRPARPWNEVAGARARAGFLVDNAQSVSRSVSQSVSQSVQLAQ